jgi:hypothetical protein
MEIMPLSMEATDGLSLDEELEVSRENSSGSSSWHKMASSSFAAVMTSSAPSYGNVRLEPRFLVRQQVRAIKAEVIGNERRIFFEIPWNSGLRASLCS